MPTKNNTKKRKTKDSKSVRKSSPPPPTENKTSREESLQSSSSSSDNRVKKMIALSILLSGLGLGVMTRSPKKKNLFEHTNSDPNTKKQTIDLLNKIYHRLDQEYQSALQQFMKSKNQEDFDFVIKYLIRNANENEKKEWTSLTGQTRRTNYS